MRVLVRYKHMWKVNIKTNLEELFYERLDWFYVFQGRDSYQGIVKTNGSLVVQPEVAILVCKANISFPGRTPLMELFSSLICCSLLI